MPKTGPASRSRWRVLSKIGLFVALIVLANLAGVWLTDLLNFELRPSNEDLVHRVIMVSAVAYALLLAIPFVPGVEIGLSLIAMLGPQIVLLVYVCTVAGLALSFAVGRMISLKGLIALFESLHFVRAARLLGTVEPLDRQQRLQFLISKTPSRFLPFLLRHRYVALAVLLNLPGNILIGGGGGIALIAGVSGLFSTSGFLATLALAVSPVPLAILVFGTGFVPG